jgi:hypothetical protein
VWKIEWKILWYVYIYVYLYTYIFIYIYIYIYSYTAPWIPKVKNLTDLTYFDVLGIEAHADDGPIDYGK